MSETIVLVLNGPNLNLLGTREPEIYGQETLADIEAACRHRGERHGLAIEFAQSNSEATLIDRVQGAIGRCAALVVNAGGYSHTSVALRDAIAAFTGPVIEVHISNIHRREPFRHHSYIASVARGSIVGLGPQGYELAIDALARLLGLERA